MRRAKIEAGEGREPARAVLAPGVVEVTLPVQPRFAQHHGFVHGSLVGFMADTACAWAAASVAGDVVTAEYKLNLLAPGIGEALIVATALATIARV